MVQGQEPEQSEAWPAAARDHHAGLVHASQGGAFRPGDLFCIPLNNDIVGLGMRIDCVMTDNGAGYKKIFQAACDELGIRHVRTRPYTAQVQWQGRALRTDQLARVGPCQTP